MDLEQCMENKGKVIRKKKENVESKTHNNEK